MIAPSFELVQKEGFKSPSGKASRDPEDVQFAVDDESSLEVRVEPQTNG